MYRYIQCGTTHRERFFDVQNVAGALGQNVCCALPGIHSFTGCDTVSAFGGKGKINALKLIQKNKKYQEVEVESGQLPPCEDCFFMHSAELLNSILLFPMSMGGATKMDGLQFA